MTRAQNLAFSTLLDAWNTHQDLRKTGAPLDELLASNQRLTEVRVNARRQLVNN